MKNEEIILMESTDESLVPYEFTRRFAVKSNFVNYSKIKDILLSFQVSNMEMIYLKNIKQELNTHFKKRWTYFLEQAIILYDNALYKLEVRKKLNVYQVILNKCN